MTDTTQALLRTKRPYTRTGNEPEAMVRKNKKGADSKRIDSSLRKQTGPEEKNEATRILGYEGTSIRFDLVSPCRRNLKGKEGNKHSKPLTLKVSRVDYFMRGDFALSG